MQNREMQRDKQVAQMLFTLKIMFMLFSLFPVFEKAFGDRKSGTLTQVKPSLMGILILVAAVGVLGVFLFSTFAEFKKRRVVLLLELSLFFALYILTLWMSGLHTSNYKFLFLFVVIYYTIAHSKQMGFLVAAGGSALVLGLDLFTGNSQDVNVYFQQDLALVVSFFVDGPVPGAVCAGAEGICRVSGGMRPNGRFDRRVQPPVFSSAAGGGVCRQRGNRRSAVRDYDGHRLLQKVQRPLRAPAGG